jgi:hypothetical protein
LREQIQNDKKLIQVTTGLYRVLLINAIATGAFGLLLLFFGDTVGKLVGMDNSMAIRIVGFGLIIFITFVYWASRQKVISANMLLVFAIIDLIWVIDSLILISYFSMTIIGLVGVLLVALLVAVFSFFEFYYYRVNRLS